MPRSPTSPPTDASRSEAADAAWALPQRIAFLGFGLIGGSVALALRAAGSRSELVAWTPGGNGPGEGLRRGLIDEAPPSVEAAVTEADLVVLAGPPLAVVSLLDELAGPLRNLIGEGAVITDVASTKGRIVERAGVLELPFVGGHPMAGRETTGVGSATADLFVDRPWVIVPTAGTTSALIDRVEALAAAVGARPIRMTAGDHDAAVAAISHLPLILAAALVESVAVSPAGAATWPAARRLAASGWSDMTRLARGDPEMGAGILATNAEAVGPRLRALREALDHWIELLDPGDATDPGALRSKLESAREALTRDPRE